MVFGTWFDLHRGRVVRVGGTVGQTGGAQKAGRAGFGIPAEVTLAPGGRLAGSGASGQSAGPVRAPGQPGCGAA